MIENEMEKFESDKAVEMRATLSRYSDEMNKLQYQMFCVDKLYKKLLDEYQTFLGTKQKEQK